MSKFEQGFHEELERIKQAAAPFKPMKHVGKALISPKAKPYTTTAVTSGTSEPKKD